MPLIGEPDPLFGKPVRFVVLFRVQVYTVPDTLLGFVIAIGLMESPSQTVCDAIDAETVGVGLTVIAAVVVADAQPLA